MKLLLIQARFQLFLCPAMRPCLRASLICEKKTYTHSNWSTIYPAKRGSSHDICGIHLGEGTAAAPGAFHVNNTGNCTLRWQQIVSN